MNSMGQRRIAVVGLLILGYLGVFSHVAWSQPATILQHLVYLNVPAYTLNLYTQYSDQRWERLTIPVGVGRGPGRKNQTPTGQGELYAKATGVTFEYGAQNPAELVGKTITHSNTFDKTTLKPVRIKMPSDMKSIFMKINSDLDAQFYKRFVLHETTDWYTVGTPASNGCIRVERDDMHRLYNVLHPSVQEGPLSSAVPITIYYDVAEYYPDEKRVVLHANIYNRQIDYVQEILADLQEAGIDTSLMNMPALEAIVQKAHAQFEHAERTIRTRLSKAPFDRLVRDEEKQLLHFTFYLTFHY
ncbi:L,D-transpeptidase family protein [candidate division KSB3 bacterium]|uniref:L,D-transpeptidase family protein n=1 Tax=candidate division KSB3 bacterium TaxID=2044937 RepID=A0A9D5JTC2_9BACT|nr:L,D-transpeptidase family protein [candidate division KSB3 bacterium]MBD3323719.1 L,D-transpeptidase family protein [candidate division KSB3 bacterium]